MIFHKQGDYWALSDCGRYSICRANIIGGGAYTAARLGVKRRDTWDGSVLLTTERYVADDQDGRVAAYRACVSACHTDAAARGGAGEGAAHV